jgi:cellulose synthase operon protein YhjQ
MKHIVILSPKGGTGKTTIAANLGRLLAERYRVMMVDADPQNSLGLLFGMPVGEAQGLAVTEFGHQGLVSMLRAQKAEVPYVPFGRPSAAALSQIESQARLDPSWLEKRLRELCPGGYDVAIIDTPAGRSVFTSQALAIATTSLVVLEACALSYSTLPDIEGLLEDAQKRSTFRGSSFVLNRLDARRALSRDVRAALVQSVGEQFIDVALVDDEHVREATANRTTCVAMSPHSQFASAMRQLANHAIEVLR